MRKWEDLSEKEKKDITDAQKEWDNLDHAYNLYFGINVFTGKKEKNE